MSQILRFLIHKKNFILFVFLEIISLILIIKSHDYARLKAYDFQTAISGSFNEKINNINKHFYLKSYNDSLLKQNAILLQKISKSTPDSFNTTLSDQFDYIPAYVLSKQFQFNHNTLLLNKGRKDSIKPEMGVMTLNAVIGVVQKTSKHFSRVISILNKNSKISVALAHTNYTGFLQWNGLDPNKFDVLDMPVNAHIKKNDTIVTSGMSSYFPKGIPVGVITDFKILQGQKSYVIKIKTLIDMTNIGPVYVINNKLKQEIDSLQNKKF